MPEITNQIYYVGVNDRNKELFEGLWPLPNGVSYNSYLIVDEKICLIDTVEVDFFIQYLENIHEVIGDRPIDYLVVNHMEPDHSGSIALIRKYYPEIKIVGNKKTFGMAEGFYGIADNLVEVKNNDTLQLGAHTLQFVLTPMVHCFGALNGGIIDAQINCDTFWLEMVRYYSNIVGKYGTPVQNALKKLAGVQLDYLCSTHGPVWHEHVQKVIGIYDRLSRYEAEEGIVICYGTMYGNTERMAEIIAKAASSAGIKNIVMYNVSKTHHSYILRDLFRYKALIVGAPTYNTGLYHEMDVLLSEISGKDMKNRLIAWFGSYSWASKAAEKIQQWNENHLHFEAVGTPVEMKQAVNPTVREQCEALGRAVAERLIADR